MCTPITANVTNAFGGLCVKDHNRTSVCCISLLVYSIFRPSDYHGEFKTVGKKPLHFEDAYFNT